MTKRRGKLLVPESRKALDQLKLQVMYNEGIIAKKPEGVKYEVAKGLGVPLEKGYNGNLTAKQVGKVGGNIGGKMVREMVRMAQEKLTKQ
ncbi:alpha/beta-type small acid-soluble spore protein [Caldalkalibacillus mannanilyticus]|uniref:alpha/beta-type small acid-soluble spore protein n=1 Tax=Caldalkalibacillus mannanilyticus TaxID=1418 RepID=UPI0004686A4C|nr:alpha/beta-type small acid-soluble spore protein [Caldalkalibacillus mannanilyticus]